MALSPFSAGDVSFRDPYDLDRLADELVSRETKQRTVRDSFEDDVPELQEHIPLSHNDPHLTAEVFDVEAFLLERKQIALPDLRAELRQYLAGLKQELVELINDDYEAFISLSTDLHDEGTRLERLKQPMAGLKANVIESKKELETIQGAIHSKLRNRAKLREEQALLHLLLKISDSVTRLESLLSISSPDYDVENSRDIGDANFLTHPSHSNNSDEKVRGNRAKHLSRVAAEYTQLLYHAQKARAEKCVFVDEIQWRIDRIQSTLSSDLDQLFSQTLYSFVDNRGTELEKNKWITDLTECLRTYDALGLWKDAEDVIRREVVRPFVKKTIHPGALASPASPIVPNTPFRSLAPEPLTSVGTAYHIPFTPFTAFVPKQISLRPSESQDIPRAHLLDETDDMLARLYNQLLRFVERDLCRIMSLAERVTVKPYAEKAVDMLSEVNGEAEERRDFQIMSHVVWDELGRSIMNEIGSVVFAAGNPKEFRKHFETTQTFLRSLELLAPSRQAVLDMRRCPVNVTFDRRWQLPVYFQLRWKEIVGALEDALALIRFEAINPRDGSFTTSQAAAVWIAISACWSSEIYLPELGHKFWKLTLQILNRYKAWLNEGVALGDVTSKGSTSDKTLASPNPTRAGTPVASETPLAESIAADDALLRQYAAVIIDIKSIETNTMRLWRQVISMMLPDTPDDDMHAEDALRESISGLTAFVENLSSKIIVILTKRCCDNLLQVRSIPTQLRMSNKRAPTEASAFVPSILRPIKQFFAIGVAEGPGSLLKDVYLQRYAREVFNNVAQRYISYLTAMRKTEESLKRLKKNTRPAFSLFGSSSNANEDVKDDERIRSQMILDVKAFGKDAVLLQVDVDSNQHFIALKEIVNTPDPE